MWGWHSRKDLYRYWKEAEGKLDNFNEDVCEKQTVKQLKHRITDLEKNNASLFAKVEVLERTNQLLANVMHVEVAKVTHKK